MNDILVEHQSNVENSQATIKAKEFAAIFLKDGKISGYKALNEFLIKISKLPKKLQWKDFEVMILQERIRNIIMDNGYNLKTLKD
jgi:hypothetical protein